MKLSDSPCRNCAEKHRACHDHCPRYQQYRGIIDAARKRAQQDGLVCDYLSENGKRRRSNPNQRIRGEQ